jgi:serine protease AprX
MQKLAPHLAQIDDGGSSQEICQVIIETAGVRSERIWSFVEGQQGQLGQEIKLISAVSASLPRAVLAGLARLAPVVKVWENTLVKVLGEAKSFPVYGGIFNAEYRFTGKGTTVAVMDTGIAPHEDLTEPDNRIIAWNDLVGAQTGPYDDHGHGTHVAGLIAGNGRASRGRYKGVAPAARLAGIKVLDHAGCGRLSDLLLGLEWCLGNRDPLKVRIINLSLGTRSQGNYRQDPLCRAVSLVWQSGIVICAAAGKVGADYRLTDSPGCDSQIITVGDLDYQKTLTSDDERLQWWHGADCNYIIPDLAVPGANVVGAKLDGGYCTYSGASTAVPLVAGGAALLLERWPRLQPNQVKRLLRQTAGDSGLGSRFQGAGLLNLDRIFGARGRQNSARGSQPEQLATFLVKSALNLFTKKNVQTTLQLKDILAALLPLLRKFLSEKKPDHESKSNTADADMVK